MAKVKRAAGDYAKKQVTICSILVEANYCPHSRYLWLNSLLRTEPWEAIWALLKCSHFKPALYCLPPPPFPRQEPAAEETVQK